MYVHVFLLVGMSMENGLSRLLTSGVTFPFPFCLRAPAVTLDIVVVNFEMEASTDCVLGTMEPEQGDCIYAYRRCLRVPGGRRRTRSVSSPYFICSGKRVCFTKKSQDAEQDSGKTRGVPLTMANAVTLGWCAEDDDLVVWSEKELQEEE